MEGLSGWCSKRVCVVSLGREANRLHGVVCWVAVLRGGARWRDIATPLLPSVSSCDLGWKYHALYSGLNGGC
jgi:hypothetical protein